MKVFDTFRLDTVNHCLWRGEERLSLPPKAFDVLRYLVEHANRLVTQDEILEALWPEIYVNPEIIKKYVLAIRKVLGDRSDKPAFVATFPRRGYQFIAAVRDEMGSGLVDAASEGIKNIVGREAALAELGAALKKVMNSQRQIVFITGEAGIGKTTLVEAFCKTAGFDANVHFVSGQCVEGFGGKEAYYPILDALGPLLGDAGEGSAFQIFAKEAPTWLVQFPTLVKAGQREALQKEIIGATRERMVREICEALESIAAQNPLVLCLEDLHWVDPSTLDFISALARRRGPAKLLLLGTYRPAEVILSQSRLKALKQDLLIHNLGHEIGLERLEESDVAEYLTLEFGSDSSTTGLANLIYRHSGGNSLFMATIVQDMVKKGLIVRADGVAKLTTPMEDLEPTVPETLQQLIEVQFEQLDAREQDILRCASVAGDRFSVWAITTAAGMEPDDIEAICEKLAGREHFIKAAGIHVLASGEFSAYYEFRHSLYREVLYRRLSEVSRSKLHQVLGHRLEALCIPCEQELATELAQHFEEGHEYEQAIRYLMLGAQNASGRFAYRDAIEILNHALELKTKLNRALSAEIEVEILELIGDAQFALGSLAESARAYSAAASRAEAAGLKTAQVRALTRAMNPLGFINSEQGLAAMDQALSVSATLDDPLLFARTQMLAAAFRLVFDDWRGKDVELCVSAYETLQRLGDLGPRSYQRMVYGHVVTLQGKYREALEIFEAGLSREDHESSAIVEYIALLGKTQVLLRTGQLGEVLRITRASRELAEKNGSAPWMFDFREAWVRTMVFDFEGALQICKAISAPKLAYLAGPLQTIDRIATGQMELDRQEYARAIEQFKQAYEPELSIKFFLHWGWRLRAEVELGNAWLLSGDIANARAAADHLLQSLQSSADPYLQALAWELKTRVAMAEKDPKGALESIQNAVNIVDKFEMLVPGWQAHATAWQLYGGMQEHKKAETHRQRAESCILNIANSFAPDEPLRASFLSAISVARILSGSKKAAGSAKKNAADR